MDGPYSLAPALGLAAATGSRPGWQPGAASRDHESRWGRRDDCARWWWTSCSGTLSAPAFAIRKSIEAILQWHAGRQDGQKPHHASRFIAAWALSAAAANPTQVAGHPAQVARDKGLSGQRPYS